MIPASTAFGNTAFGNTAFGSSGLWTPEWLVSVRSLAEATIVSRFGVDILDWKEPSDGALAPVKTSVLAEAVRCSGEYSRGPSASMIRLSAALGEPDQSRHLASGVPPQFAFAKSGPSGLNTQAKLCDHWHRLRGLLPESVELVAVAYADHEIARTIPPEEVLKVAIRFGLSRILIDTIGKQSGSACEILGASRLARFGHEAHGASIWWSLAGSISLQSLSGLLQNQDSSSPRSLPDCVAVRGAICDGSREGDVSEKRLREWALSRNAGFDSLTQRLS